MLVNPSWRPPAPPHSAVAGFLIEQPSGPLVLRGGLLGRPRPGREHHPVAGDRPIEPVQPGPAAEQPFGRIPSFGRAPRPVPGGGDLQLGGSPLQDLRVGARPRTSGPDAGLRLLEPSVPGTGDGRGRDKADHEEGYHRGENFVPCPPPGAVPCQAASMTLRISHMATAGTTAFPSRNLSILDFPERR